MYVDNAAMQLVRQVREQFDVHALPRTCSATFISDELAADHRLGGDAARREFWARSALGAAPDGGGSDLYEPSGGSARRTLRAKGIANPIAQILSAALLLRYSFGEEEAACAIENAVRAVIDGGLRTGDIYAGEGKKVSTKEMGAAVVDKIIG